MYHRSLFIFPLIMSIAFATVGCVTLPSSAPQSDTAGAVTLPAIIPQPCDLVQGNGYFAIESETRIVADYGAREVADQLATYLAPAMGFRLKVLTRNGLLDNVIELNLRPSLAGFGPEEYRLDVDVNGVHISAATPAGLFYGVQTLRQLLPPEIFSDNRVKDVSWRVPIVTIQDQPRFRWRGMHLDVCRHFMPKAFVKKYVDLIALHKMNVFHWHLTEDQGWRIEIKKYPKLTEVGAWRKETLVGHMRKPPHSFDGERHGGFYTQAEIREIVAYAKQRFVTVVPEIEMPGHAQAAIAAYPHLGVTDTPLAVRQIWGVSQNIFNVEESTIQFMQDVLTEVLDLFDSPFIHIGGDEAPKTQWKESARVQARMEELGIPDEHALQSWFIKRMDTFLTERGRRLIGWDEILEGGLAPGATVMSWRGQKGGVAAAQAGHDVVMAANGYTYFDYYQGDRETEPLAIGGNLPLERVYSFDPVPADLSAAEAVHILGVQGQVWTEYIPTPEHAEYMAFPRACALSEVAWTPVSKKDYQNFDQRLRQHMQRLQVLDVNAGSLDRD
ncbi:beta-N-acetylhexosaminidase [Planctomycetota bacterium]